MALEVPLYRLGFLQRELDTRVGPQDSKLHTAYREVPPARVETVWRDATTRACGQPVCYTQQIQQVSTNEDQIYPKYYVTGINN